MTPHPYMAMELFTRTKMNGRTRMEEERKKLRRSMNEQYQEYASMSDKEKEEVDARIRFQQEEIRLKDISGAYNHKSEERKQGEQLGNGMLKGWQRDI
ncbi:unnamed protein product [Caenorhabditis nigoni]